MFKIGDIVRHERQKIVGEVVEIDGDTVYLEQDNGAEVDFPASTLTLESDFQKRHGAPIDDADARRNDPLYDAVIANLYPKIVEIGQIAYGKSDRAAVTSWSNASALQKLNAISSATDIPVKDWLDANRPSAKPSLANLQLAYLAKQGKS
jgi:hypothetical protein